MKRWLVIVIIAAALVVVGGMGWIGYKSSQAQATPPSAPPTTAATVCDVEQTIDSPGSVVNTQVVSIQMPTAGSLADILVSPGDHVSSGQVLAHLSDPDSLSAALANAHVQLLQAQRALQDVTNQAPVKTAQAYQNMVDAQKTLDDAKTARYQKNLSRASQATVDSAHASLVIAQDELKRAQENYNQFANRPENDVMRAQAFSRLAAAQQKVDQEQANLTWMLAGPDAVEINQADAAIQVAQAQLDVAQSNWEQVKNGPDALALQQAHANVDLAQAQYQVAQAAYAAIEIKAPFAGVIGTVDAKVGDSTPASSTLFTLIDPTAVEVQGSVVEEDYPYVSIGQAAGLYFDALPDLSITGKVAGIVPQRLPGSSPTYLVRFSLDNVPDKLVDGMTADATIVIAQRKGVLCLPRSLVHSSSGSKAQVSVWDGAAVATRQVTVGLRGDSNVEILSGLSEGEKVVIQ